MTDYPQKNLLANALSPYLLQHKGNPVHWRQWGPDAFAEARATGRPILLSIGYAACHWCHVMAHESFENDEIAALMNRGFVNIKVDREERPDIDQIYMAALHAMGEQGGWPLTMFLTPDGMPFWGGTYFPPISRYGRPGFPDVLAAITELYRRDPDRAAQNAATISRHLHGNLSTSREGVSPDAVALDSIADRLLSAIDDANGGIGAAPKFPSMPMWECLWRASLRRRDHRFADAALSWMRALCNGGIYDHLGGGLHRYTVDERWLVPHFEKMLYDNAQFVRSLCLCYRATGQTLFRSRIEETVEFLLSDMRLPGCGFASSFDADSAGVEGGFYVWTSDEIDEVLGSDAGEFSKIYDVHPAGNWEGKSILNRLTNAGEDDAAQTAFLDSCRKRLLARRNARVAPALDDKVLTDWNALAIRALVDAGRLLGRPEWIDAAEKAFDFIVSSVAEEGLLMHAYRDGRTSTTALATDLAAMIEAALALYTTRLDDRFLAAASGFAERLQTSHADGHGSYFLAPSSQTDLSLRAYSDHDEAVPSASAMVISALSRLSIAANDPGYAEKAGRALAAAWGRVEENPFSSIGVVNAADDIMRGGKLVTVGEFQVFEEIVSSRPDPARIDIHVPEKSAAEKLVGALPDDTAANGRALAYLCRGMTCLPPVSDPRTLARLIEGGSEGP